MKYYLSLVFCIFVLNSNAQFSIEIGGGYNSSSAILELESINTGPINGYFIHVVPSYGLTNKFKTNLEVGYKIQGESSEFEYIKDTYYRRSKYIYIAPQIEYSILSYLNIYSGIGFGVQTVEEYKIGTKWFVNKLNKEPKYDIDAQIGVKLKVKRVYFTIGYSRGLKDVNDISYRDDEGHVIPNIKKYNTNLKFGVGIRLI